MKGIKDLTIYKRLLAILTAGMISLSSLPVLAEGEIDENINSTSITMLNEELEPTQIDFDEYMERVVELIESADSLAGNNNSFTQYLPEGYFWTNPEYFKDIGVDLMEEGLITENNGNEACLAVINVFDGLAIANSKKLEKTSNIDELFDISQLCCNENIRELAHRAFEKYVEAYTLGTKDCESFKEFMEILDVLKEKNYMGMYFYFVHALKYLCQKCMLQNFSKKELNKYYNNARMYVFQLKNADIEWDLMHGEPQNELEEYISIYVNIYPDIVEWKQTYDKTIESWTIKPKTN